jgi:UDPglucose 6-dehydrogenase
MKISFANEMAQICERVGADIRQVAQGIGLDKRIGANFLNAGIGWGGNQRQRLVPITKLQEELKIIKGRTIGLLGLSFKPNTDDLRDAPSLTIAAQLLKMGAQVKAYDPVASAAARAGNPDLDIIYCDSVSDLSADCDALVLVTEWDEFRHIDWKATAGAMRKPLIIDGRNFLPEIELNKAGFTYRGIGR